MKFLIPIILICGLAAGAAAQPPKADYPSCDIAGQRTLMAQAGGSIKNANQAHISMRANVIEADLSTAAKGGQIDRAEADRMFRQVEKIRYDSEGYTKQQGFLSAAERASYDRELDVIALRLCSAKPTSNRASASQAIAKDTKMIGAPNPASVFCEKRGGRSILKGGDGYCHLPNGRVIEEWKLFRQAHGKR